MKAEVVARKTEVATGNVNKDHLFSEAHCLIFVSDRTSSQPRKTLAIALGCYYLTNGYFYWIEKILVVAKMAIAWMIFQIVI
ncbi:hypothetical protein AMR41_09555 [Hapalosiphon sp. MRB220]|nr:hypothetical protein AMR41_09555 [Hapalosiphon sp. MRB220]